MNVPTPADRARERALLASDEDRETYVGILEAAYADGRLDADALEQRSGALWSATTMGQLHDVVADLLRSDPPVPRPARSAERSTPAQAQAARVGGSRLALLGGALGLLIVMALVATAIARTSGGSGDGVGSSAPTGPAATDMFTASGMAAVVADFVAAAGTTGFEEVLFYGDYAIAYVLGAPGGDRMARLDWRDGEVEVEPDAAAPADIESLLFDPTTDIDLVTLSALARGAAERTGVADASSMYLYVERVASSGDHEIQARVLISNDYQNGSIVADHAGVVITAEGPGVDPQPTRFLLADGVRDAISGVKTRIGGPLVLEILFYGEYVLVEAPPEPGASVVASFSYRGGATAVMDATVPSQPDQVETGLFSLDELDPEVVATLVAEAPDLAGVTDVETTYVYVQRSTTADGAPVQISVYVSGAYDSGRVVADLTGRVLEVF